MDFKRNWRVVLGRCFEIELLERFESFECLRILANQKHWKVSFASVSLPRTDSMESETIVR
jgi:hypothetical protein